MDRVFLVAMEIVQFSSCDLILVIVFMGQTITPSADKGHKMRLKTQKDFRLYVDLSCDPDVRTG